jgi:hypothetical protein
VISYCTVDDCDQRVAARKLCRKHYWRMRQTGTTDDPPPPRNQSPCAFGDCDKPARSRGWCDTHYTRWKMHGDPSIVLKIKPPSRTPCTIHDCDTLAVAHGYCDRHYRNWRRHGDPARPPLSQTYDAVHDRLRRANGPASQHLCIQCFDPAREWAYLHDDPNPLTEWMAKGQSRPSWVTYSTDPSRYQPMCVRCHRNMDSA